MTDNYNQNYKKETMDAMKYISMDVLGHKGTDYDEYKDDVLDWSWDNIQK